MSEVLLIFVEEVLPISGSTSQPPVPYAVIRDSIVAEDLVGSMAQPLGATGYPIDRRLFADLPQSFFVRGVLKGFDGRHPLGRPARAIASQGGARRAAAGSRA